ncbi:hypothetical protein ACVDG9_18400 [Roseibium sp. RP-7]
MQETVEERLARIESVLAETKEAKIKITTERITSAASSFASEPGSDTAQKFLKEIERATSESGDQKLMGTTSTVSTVTTVTI